MLVKKKIWAEKYNPSSLDEYIFINKDDEKYFKKYISSNEYQNLILFGPAGTGKSTLARLLAKEIGSKTLFMNASDERKIDDIRNKVKEFTKLATFGKPKVIIFDEGEQITPDAQDALKGIMDAAKNTVFIFTTNNINLITEPIQSRCKLFKIQNLPKDEILKRIIRILDNEKIQYTEKDLKYLAKIIQSFYPDFRKILNFVQSISINGKLETKDIPDSILLKLLKLIKKKDINAIRKLFSENYEEVTNTNIILKFLFKNIKNIVENDNGEAEIIIAEHLYKDGLMADKEINLLACIYKLFNLV